MQYGKIENYKITGTCLMQTPDFPDEIPDDARLFDYLIDGVLYTASEYVNKIPTAENGVVTWVDDMETLRADKLREITAAFDAAFTNGAFVSATLGIEVDCRRSGTKNDEQNVRGLISRMSREGIKEVEYKGKTESVTASLEQIQSLQYEMEDYSASLYAKKWAAEKALADAQSMEEVEKIAW